jgi:uncharacterized protein YjbI with pentapeptide repeats
MTASGPAKKPGMARRIGVAAFTVAGFLAAPLARAVCPPSCAGQTLTTPNFSHQDLTGADFTGATIIGAAFIRANLTGAKFDNAKFQSVPGFPTQTPDFSFANLSNASFTGAQFLAPTYLTYANLTCADFSNTDISNGNAVFGDERLIYHPEMATCPVVLGDIARTKFRNTIMNCEFINDWKAFDLTGADVSACSTQLAGRDFSGALMSGVDLTGAVLDGAKFIGANLTLATLRNASLQCTPAGQCVDMSNALLQGSHFDNANLTGANLFGAFLSNNNTVNITDAATMTQAHLKNVNLATAQLSGVRFTLANFYGKEHSNPNGCATTIPNSDAGFTVLCASARGATLTATDFTDAYLFGVDFTNATILGGTFYEAVVTGANFAGATIGTDPNSGAGTDFSRAFLQGTNLDKATTLTRANFSNAFFDFRRGGNSLFILLNGTNHNQFACSTPSTCNPASGLEVCLQVFYPLATVPGDNISITCPDGDGAAKTGGCGDADPTGGNARWMSHLTIGKPPDPGPPPGFYENDSTYTPRGSLPIRPPTNLCTANW